MKFLIEHRDLFSVPENYSLAHCISADLGMSKGIAVEFNKRFSMKSRLLKQFGTALVTSWDKNPTGHCIHEDRVFNLITKRNYWNKPTYKSLTEALIECKNQCEFLNIENLAMPVIGCGLDKLEWSKVEEIIKDVFKNTNISILICIK